MPTYAYECAACGHGLEEFQTMTAKPLRKCPACKALKLKRLIGPGGGFIFKGTGFYITDYKNKKTGNDGASKERNGDSSDAPAKKSEGSKQSDSKQSDSKTSDSKSSDSKTSDAPKSDRGGSDSDNSGKGSSGKGSSGKGSSGKGSSGKGRDA